MEKVTFLVAVSKPDHMMIIVDCLKDHEFEVREASSEAEAREALIREPRPSIAIVGVGAAEFNGISLAESLYLAKPQIPVIIFADPLNDQVMDYATLRGMRCLRKPLRKSVIWAAVWNLMSNLAAGQTQEPNITPPWLKPGSAKIGS
jgi:DNA-binding NarL/FixJ family response regulator